MEYENPTSGKETSCVKVDIISTLPQNMIDSILSLIPLREAVRTSILSKKWRYSWRSMTKVVFTDYMVEPEFNRYKLVNAIFHVLLFHNGPTILEFVCSVGEFRLESEFVQMISFLARGDKLKEFIFSNDYNSFKLPVCFFSLQGLEAIDLFYCIFEPPLTFNIFGRLKTMKFASVEVSAQTLQRFLSKCPLLEHIHLSGNQEIVEFVAGENKFTFVDLLQCVPLIQSLSISMYYMKHLSSGCMPRMLPTSLPHLKDLFLQMCLMEQIEISSALCIIRSSPVLERIIFRMYDNENFHVQQTPTNFFDPEGNPDLHLDHLENMEIRMASSNTHLVMEFVKLIMAKSPVLKKLQIVIWHRMSVGEELKFLNDMLILSFPRASPYAKLIIKRQ